MAELEPQPTTRGLLFKQSSELEILISAAIVFAVFNVMDIVPGFIVSILNHNVSNTSPFVIVAVLLALFLSTLLPISIVIHFILRFYWLSLLGLKTTFQAPRIEKLKYAPRYLEFIRKRSNLDRHIEFIDKLCSSIFAFSFLTAFVFCFTTLSVSLIIGVLIYLIDTVLQDSWLQGVFILLLNVFIVICLVCLFDFFSLGLVKRIKKKWFVRIYYPINRLMGLITLSYFYRGLYYTFITNIPKRIAVFVLPLYLGVAVLWLNAGFYDNRLYVEDSAALRVGQFAALTSYYQENFSDESEVQVPFIPSYYIGGSYLPLYIPITEQIDDALVAHCDSLQPINHRGFHWRRFLKLGPSRRSVPRDFDYKKNAEAALGCFRAHVKITIDDSVYRQQSFRFRKITEPSKTTFLTTLDLSGIGKGDHVLRVELLEPIGADRYELAFYKTD